MSHISRGKIIFVEFLLPSGRQDGSLGQKLSIFHLFFNHFPPFFRWEGGGVGCVYLFDFLLLESFGYLDGSVGS